ncbi:hypothetical protein [uncultured Kordia sp.]|nr:hypothetical protein [uncultured Kordia sp.]
MKKIPLKKIKLVKNVISKLDTISGGLAAGGSEISYCSAGTRIECCARK